jgi:hypothetical protein
MDTSGTLQVSVADHGTTMIKEVAGLTITSLPIKPTDIIIITSISLERSSAPPRFVIFYLFLLLNSKL